MQKYPAIVLLGPTGSGKTPLGALLEERGDSGYVHFDFGENLRRVARSKPDEIVSLADIEFVRSVLETGTLLEDRDFPIAQRVLSSFLHSRHVTGSTKIVMNGLPRHAGQAGALAATLNVFSVVVLECTASVVLQRIASNVGGDRAERADDDVAAVRRKLAIFARRTAPLVDYYRQQGVDATKVPVTAAMTAAEMWGTLQGGLLARSPRQES